MSLSMISLAEAILLVSALSLDALVASFAYGTKRIKIPFSSALIVAGICTGTMALTLAAGALLRPFLSPSLTNGLCFSILFLLGCVKLFDSLLKQYIKKSNHSHGIIKFSLFDLKFILAVYADPEKADADASNTLSAKEAAVLATALSLDGAAVGFGAGISDFNLLFIILLALLVNLAAVVIGCRLGNRVLRKTSKDLSFISGIFLIVLAFSKLF